MPVLKVANIHFHSAGVSRLEFRNDNVVRIFANAEAVASGTVANRPTAENGLIRYNTDYGKLEFYQEGTWDNVAGQLAVSGSYDKANSANLLAYYTRTGTESSTMANGIPVIRVYNSPATWTKPANLKSIKVTVVSGGGGSSGCQIPGNTGNGGGGGAVAIFVKTSSAIPGPIAVTVGAGGTAGPSPGGAGGNGGTSSFGAIASCTGGTGGTIPTLGAGGTATGGDVNWPGAGADNVSGLGGTSFWTAGAAPLDSSGKAYGGGAPTRSAVGSPANPGLAGAAGIVLVEEYY